MDLQKHYCFASLRLSLLWLLRSSGRGFLLCWSLEVRTLLGQCGSTASMFISACGVSMEIIKSSERNLLIGEWLVAVSKWNDKAWIWRWYYDKNVLVFKRISKNKAYSFFDSSAMLSYYNHLFWLLCDMFVGWNRVRILVLSLNSCVTLDKLPKFSRLWFPHLRILITSIQGCCEDEMR